MKHCFRDRSFRANENKASHCPALLSIKFLLATRMGVLNCFDLAKKRLGKKKVKKHNLKKQSWKITAMLTKPINYDLVSSANRRFNLAETFQLLLSSGTNICKQS